MSNTTRPILKCRNGRFAGEEKNGVLIFKGIPFAKPPVGNLRWRPPQPPEDSDELFEAIEFGASGLQYECYSEAASQNRKSEDCLTLNIWTADFETKKKPIMFYIHGGGFTFGGSADPLYSGEFLVREHKDIVMISTNYRIGMMGFMDLSGIPGGEDYPEGPYLALLDLIQSLKWVKENADSFGGDPDNITIFGESAGGTLVSSLLVADGTEGLFKRVIAHSGTINLTYTEEDLAVEREKGISMAQCLAAKTGAKNMDELVAVSANKLFEAYTEIDEETGLCLNDTYTMPLRGGRSPIPENPYEALEKVKAKDVDLIIGTVADEWRYWVTLMNDVDITGLPEEKQAEIIEQDLAMYEQFIGWQSKALYDFVSDEEKAAIDKFMAGRDDEQVWKDTELQNEVAFRIPSVEFAYRHALGGGRTYMYLFEKRSTLYDWLGACHAVEVAYALHNLEATQFAGEIDKDLADGMCSAWTNFARTGDPSTDKVQWTGYGPETRDTMIFGNDGIMKMVRDPKKEQRELLAFASYCSPAYVAGI
ncbi:MAG: carboxylesterase family protein [Bacillota bacterium]|nr:carboxylesterase family protein [Bacillota bacterium]